MSINKKVLKVEDLRIYFHTKSGDAKAVDGNHFTMYENETLAFSQTLQKAQAHFVQKNKM